MLIAFIIITVIIIGLILWGWKDGCEDTIGMGFGLLIIVGLYGWGLMGLGFPLRTTTTETMAKVLHDQNACHLSVSNVIIATYTDVATFKFLSEKETIKVIKTQKYNMYGGGKLRTQDGEFPIINNENYLFQSQDTEGSSLC